MDQNQLYHVYGDQAPLQNVAAVLEDWAILAQSLPKGYLRDRAYWGAVSAVEQTAQEFLAVVVAARPADEWWTPTGVAREIVDRRAKW